jgi:hypothetical protein
MKTSRTMTGWRLAVSLVALLASVACGKSEQQKQAEAAAKQMEEAARKLEEAGRNAAAGSADMAKGLEAMAKGLGALGAGNGQVVEPVGFRELQTVFVDVPGWEKAKPTGEKMTAPVPLSRAKVVYRKGDARIEATLVDSGFNQLLLLPYAWIQNMGYEKESADGYEKAVKVAGHPGFEKWNSARKDGEVHAFVDKRFILQLEGHNIGDPKVLHEFASATQLAKLATLNAGAPAP